MLNMLHIKDPLFKIKKYLQITQIILIKHFLITPLETWVWENIEPSDSKFEFAGGVANWCRLGYELSVVTTDVVWIHSNWLIADDILHC